MRPIKAVHNIKSSIGALAWDGEGQQTAYMQQSRISTFPQCHSFSCRHHIAWKHKIWIIHSSGITVLPPWSGTILTIPWHKKLAGVCSQFSTCSDCMARTFKSHIISGMPQQCHCINNARLSQRDQALAHTWKTQIHCALDYQLAILWMPPSEKPCKYVLDW